MTYLRAEIFLFEEVWSVRSVEHKWSTAQVIFKVITQDKNLPIDVARRSNVSSMLPQSTMEVTRFYIVLRHKMNKHN